MQGKIINIVVAPGSPSKLFALTDHGKVYQWKCGYYDGWFELKDPEIPTKNKEE